MNTTSRLIDETLREWDDYAAIEEEECFERIVAPPESRRSRKAQSAHAVQPQASSVRPGYTVSSTWDDAAGRGVSR